MNKKLQESGNTRVDRFPGLIESIHRIKPDSYQSNVASFGCSTGEEIFSIANYYKSATIVGIEFNVRRREICRRKIQDIPNASVVSPENSPSNFDLIFALSVLCKFPSVFPLPYSDFDITLTDLVSKLREDGILVVLNSNYSVSSSLASSFLEPIDLPCPWGLSVPQYNSKLERIATDRRFAFRRISKA